MQRYFYFSHYPYTVLTNATNHCCSCYQRLPSNSTCLACKSKTFCTSDIKTSYCPHYDHEALKCSYMKTTCLISFKLTAFNNDTFSYLNIKRLNEFLCCYKILQYSLNNTTVVFYGLVSIRYN